MGFIENSISIYIIYKNMKCIILKIFHSNELINLIKCVVFNFYLAHKILIVCKYI